jgi:hypothetical protein
MILESLLLINTPNARDCALEARVPGPNHLVLTALTNWNLNSPKRVRVTR